MTRRVRFVRCDGSSEEHKLALTTLRRSVRFLSRDGSGEGYVVALGGSSSGVVLLEEFEGHGS